MSWLWLAAAGAANFTFIGLKAFQQRNVIHGDFGLVVLTSNLLAFAEVFVVYTIASKGVVLPLIFTLGMSGGLGCVFAMKIHDRMMRRRDTDGKADRENPRRQEHAARRCGRSDRAPASRKQALPTAGEQA